MYINSCIRPNTRVLVVMDYPSVNDITEGYIRDSHSVAFMSRQLKRFGVEPDQISFHHFLWERLPFGTEEKDLLVTTIKGKKTAVPVAGGYIHEDYQANIDSLLASVNGCNPEVILCMSSLALATLADADNVNSFRGSMMRTSNAAITETNIVPTYSIYTVYKQPEVKMAFDVDLNRLAVGLNGPFALPEYSFLINPTFEQATDFLEELLAELRLPYSFKVRMGFDVETRNQAISFAGIATSETTAICIPFIDKDGYSYWPAEQEFALIKLLKEVLEHPRVESVMQNGQYDIQYTATRYSIYPYLHIDTMVDGHMLFQKGLQLDLAYLSSLFCEYYRYWKQDGKDFHNSFQNDSDYVTYQTYNCYDTCYTLELSYKMKQSLDVNVHPFVLAFQRKMQNAVIRAVLRGVRWDYKTQMKWYAEHKQLLDGYAAWFNYIIPDSIVTKQGNAPWWDSPAKMAHLFYDQLGLKEVVNRKTKKRTTSDDALIEVGRAEPVMRLICKILRDYRSARKVFDTYLSALPSKDGRMRTQYMVPGTDTYRLASKGDAFGEGLNLQNLSKG